VDLVAVHLLAGALSAFCAPRRPDRSQPTSFLCGIAQAMSSGRSSMPFHPLSLRIPRTR
jgi:hypothetical protein